MLQFTIEIICFRFVKNLSRLQLLKYRISIKFIYSHQIPDPTSGIFDIAFPSRNQMHMAVEYRLSSINALVDPDVVTGDR